MLSGLPMYKIHNSGSNMVGKNPIRMDPAKSFEVVDHEAKVRCVLFKIADPIWQIKSQTSYIWPKSKHPKGFFGRCG